MNTIKLNPHHKYIHRTNIPSFQGLEIRNSEPGATFKKLVEKWPLGIASPIKNWLHTPGATQGSMGANWLLARAYFQACMILPRPNLCLTNYFITNWRKVVQEDSQHESWCFDPITHGKTCEGAPVLPKDTTLQPTRMLKIVRKSRCQGAAIG